MPDRDLPFDALHAIAELVDLVGTDLVLPISSMISSLAEETTDWDSLRVATREALSPQIALKLM
ncbi:MAG: hypothetical protein ACLQPN_11160 [Bryobacteraceae bacterium]